MQKLFISLAVLLLAVGCSSQPEATLPSPVNQTTSAPATEPPPVFPPLPPKEAPHPAPVGKMETTKWKTYTSKTYGFSFQYPASWKIAEYTYTNVNDGSSGISSVALDPVKVGTQYDHDHADMRMGMVQMYLGTGQPIGYDSFGDTTLGPKAFPAHYARQTTGDTSPNPSWVHTTTESYYLYLPEKFHTKAVETMELRVAYPNEKAKDTELQNTLQTILSTFIFQQ